MQVVGSVENDVLIGEDGYLFLAGGGHGVLDFVLGKTKVPDASYATFADNINRRNALCVARGATYRHLIVPDKQSVMSEQFPFPLAIRLGSDYISKAGQGGARIIYPIDVLQSQAGVRFFRTDTHMTDFGTILMVGSVVNALTSIDIETEVELLISKLIKEQTINGDLGSKLKIPLLETQPYLEEFWPLHRFSNCEVISTNNGIVDIWISPKSKIDSRLVIFGDSFGRIAARILSFFFREVVFARSPFFHSELVEQINPDYVLTENVERYLSNVLPDSHRPNFHMYPYLTAGVSQGVPSHAFSKAFSALLSYGRKPYYDFMRKLLG